MSTYSLFFPFLLHHVTEDLGSRLTFPENEREREREGEREREREKESGRDREHALAMHVLYTTCCKHTKSLHTHYIG